MVEPEAAAAPALRAVVPPAPEPELVVEVALDEPAAEEPVAELEEPVAVEEPVAEEPVPDAPAGNGVRTWSSTSLSARQRHRREPLRTR